MHEKTLSPQQSKSTWVLKLDCESKTRVYLHPCGAPPIIPGSGGGMGAPIGKGGGGGMPVGGGGGAGGPAWPGGGGGGGGGGGAAVEIKKKIFTTIDIYVDDSDIRIFNHITFVSTLRITLQSLLHSKHFQNCIELNKCTVRVSVFSRIQNSVPQCITE